MQTYRPPVRMMANGGGVEMPLEQELSQRNIYSDIYQDLLGYYGKERDEKIYGLSDKYGMTPGEVLNAYQEGSNMTETRPVPQGTSEGSDPVDISMPRSSALNFLEQLVGPTVYGVGESAIGAVKEKVVDPVIQYAGDRLEAISPENRGTLSQDIFDKILTPQEDGGSTDPNYIDPNSAYGQMMRGASTAPVDPNSAYAEMMRGASTAPVDTSAIEQMISSASNAVGDLGANQLGEILQGLPPSERPGNIRRSEAIADSNLNGYLSDAAQTGRDASNLEASIQREQDSESRGKEVIGPFRRLLEWTGVTGEDRETNRADLQNELVESQETAWYESGAREKPKGQDSLIKSILDKNTTDAQLIEMARLVEGGQDVSNFFGAGEEGVAPVLPTRKPVEKKTGEEGGDLPERKPVEKKTGEEGGDLPGRKPAPPKLEKAAMDAVASGSIDSFLDKLSQKDLLAMAVGFLGATSVTAGTKAALANLLKSKEAAEALALAKQKAKNDRDFLNVRYGNQSAGVTQRTAAILNTINKDNPLFGTPLEYKSKFRMANGEEPPKYGSPAHLVLQAQSNDKVTRLYGLSAGGGVPYVGLDGKIS